MHVDSIAPLLRSILSDGRVASSELYSCHSLRRGFANWAVKNGWDIKTLMSYVGWKDVQSAVRYVDAADPFAKIRLEKVR